MGKKIPWVDLVIRKLSNNKLGFKGEERKDSDRRLQELRLLKSLIMMPR